MADLTTTETTVTVKLSLTERIFAMRGDVKLQQSQISSAEVIDDGLKTARGIRAPGLSLPGLIKIGTWRRPGGRALISVRRGNRALSLSMSPQSDWARVVIDCEEPEVWAERLSL